MQRPTCPLVSPTEAAVETPVRGGSDKWRGKRAPGPRVLIVHPRLKLADVKSLLQNGQVVTVAQAGHSVQRDEYQAFIDVVLPFLLAASQVQ